MRTFILFFCFFLFAQDSRPATTTLGKVEGALQHHLNTGIIYEGMFDYVRNFGEGTLNALDTIATGSQYSAPLRALAIRAIGELGDKSAIPLLKSYSSSSSTEIKQEIEFALYHLGETRKLDQQLAQLSKEIQALAGKSAYQLPVETKHQLVTKYSEQARLSYRMRQYQTTCDAYDGLFQIRPDAYDLIYNYACALAVAGHTERAIERLNYAVDMKLVFSVEQLQNDGDLRSLRSEPEYIKLIQKLRSKVKENY